jgi:hypothetical protein
MEPSGTYGDSLRSQFLEYGIVVYRVSVDQRAIMTHLQHKTASNIDPLCYSLRDNKITEELEDVSSGDNSKDTSLLFCREQEDPGD